MPRQMLVLMAASLVVLVEAPVDAQEAVAASEVQAAVVRLQSADPSERLGAVNAMAMSRDAAAVPHLVPVLRGDPSPEVRRAAARALGQLSTDDGQRALVEASRSDPDAEVRSIAAAFVPAESPAPPPPTASAAAPALLAPQPGSPPPTAPAVTPQPQSVVIAPPPSPPSRPRRSGRRLIRAGWATLGSIWGLCVLGGGITGLVGWAVDDEPTATFGGLMVVPVIGPALASTWTWHSPDTDAAEAMAYNVIFYLLSFAQVAGLGMLIAGYVRESRRDTAQERPSFGIAFAPSAPGGAPGMSVSGWFF